MYKSNFLNSMTPFNWLSSRIFFGKGKIYCYANFFVMLIFCCLRRKFFGEGTKVSEEGGNCLRWGEGAPLPLWRKASLLIKTTMIQISRSLNYNTYFMFLPKFARYQLLRLRLHTAIYCPDSFVLMPCHCANLKAIKYESMSLNRIVADKSHRAIVA